MAEEKTGKPAANEIKCEYLVKTNENIKIAIKPTADEKF